MLILLSLAILPLKLITGQISTNGTFYTSDDQLHLLSVAGNCVFEFDNYPPCQMIKVFKNGSGCALDDETDDKDYDVFSYVKKIANNPFDVPLPAAPNECVNFYMDCSVWASSGECAKNPSWMHTNCKNSCEMCLGWTVVQRRFDGSVNFNRGWDDYKHGFGDVSGEFWLGLERMHRMTSEGDYTLRFDMWDGDEHRFAEYQCTSIENEADSYRLNYEAYQGNAGDSLAAHARGMMFSTPDRDNDLAPVSCARERSSGFWFRYCSFVNPNGLFNANIYWKSFRGLSGALSRMEMKMKRIT